jgi:plastocyanin
MFRSLAAVLATLALLAVGLMAAPVATAGDPCYHGFQIPDRSEAAETQIKVAPCAFAPTVTHVAVGSTVTFFNGPDFTHLVTGANAEWGSRDTELRPGQTVSYRFDTPGIYPYACALHRGMSGAIVVGDLAAPAAAAPASASSATASQSGAGTGPWLIAAGTVGALGLIGLGVLIARRRRPAAI